MIPTWRHTALTVTPKRPPSSSTASCPAGQRLFFEPRHVRDPGSLAGQARVCPLQRRIDVRIRQGAFQLPHSRLESLKFINLSGSFHSYYLSSGSIAILPHPSGHRPFAFDAILHGNVLKCNPSHLQLPHHFHLEGFAIPNLFPSPMLFWPLQECSGSFSLSGIKVQSTQMEEDVRLETLFVPIAKGLFDQPLDFIV